MPRLRSYGFPRVLHLFDARAPQAALCQTRARIVHATVRRSLVTCKRCLALMRQDQYSPAGRGLLRRCSAHTVGGVHGRSQPSVLHDAL